MSHRINFAVDEDVDGAEPFAFVTKVPSGEILHLKCETVDLQDLHDVDPGTISLDVEGFEFVRSLYSVDMASSQGWENSYCESMVQWLKRRLRARQVTSMGYEIRRRNPDKVVDIHQAMGTSGMLQPACAAHIDVSQVRGIRTCKQWVDCDSQKDRCAIYNIWRPLRGPVVDCPLAICDAKTLSLEDVSETTDKFEGGYYIRYNPKQRWYYIKNQKPDEMLVFKSYDNQVEPNDGSTFGTAHSAFIDMEHAAVPGILPRQSIELRLAVVF